MFGPYHITVICQTHKKLQFQNLHFAFPVEESVLDCYQNRQSCLDNDFDKEVEEQKYTIHYTVVTLLLFLFQVEYLFAKFSEFRSFVIDWLEFGEKIGNMATEEELEL